MRNVAEAGTLLELEIDGMHCEACVRRASRALAAAGVGKVQEVSVGGARVTVPVESAAVLVAALDNAGFSARVRE